MKLNLKAYLVALGTCLVLPLSVAGAADVAVQENSGTQAVSLPKIIAHRGFSSIAPENTGAAFQKAVDLGVNLIELDVQQSLDGKLIVMHDATVDRTAKGAYKGKLSNLLLTQIKALDAGSWKSPAYAGEKVLTLEETFTAFKGKAVFLVEIKATGIERKVADAIRTTGMADSVVVQSFDVNIVRRFREEMPEVLAGVLFNNSSITDAVQEAESFLKQTLAVKGQFVAAAQAAVTTDFVRYIHSNGLPVYVWTVDDQYIMRRMVDAGVDGIITNYPDRLKEVLTTYAAK